MHLPISIPSFYLSEKIDHGVYRINLKVLIFEFKLHVHTLISI